MEVRNAAGKVRRLLVQVGPQGLCRKHAHALRCPCSLGGKGIPNISGQFDAMYLLDSLA